MVLNVKQYDTEETCIMRPGEKLNYTWRTHKKSQLIQLFNKHHRVVSNPFKINHNGIQEVEFIALHKQSSDKNTRCCFLTCLVSVETKYKAGQSSFFTKTDLGSVFKKYVLIQSKFVVCNFTNINVGSFSLNYTFMNKPVEISSSESIPKLCRSSTTFEIFRKNSNSTPHSLEINSVKINNQLVVFNHNAKTPNLVYNMLRSGVLCFDNQSSIKYWLNLSEQTFSVVSSGSGGSNQQVKIVQFNLVLTPLFVFCSYLPYDLNVEFVDLNKSKYGIKSNSISYCTSQTNDTSAFNELSIKFDHMFKSGERKNSPTLTRSVGFLESIDGSRVWFEQNVNLLETGSSGSNPRNFNISTCESNANKKLLHTNLFDYCNANDEFDLSDGSDNSSTNAALKSIDEFKLTIVIDSNGSNMVNEKSRLINANPVPGKLFYKSVNF